jgi:hypothetical protein
MLEVMPEKYLNDPVKISKHIRRIKKKDRSIFKEYEERKASEARKASQPVEFTPRLHSFLDQFKQGEFTSVKSMGMGERVDDQYIEYIEADYHSWFRKNITSFNPFIISEKVFDQTYDVFEDKTKSRVGLFGNESMPLFYQNELRLPFERFWIERDGERSDSLYTETVGLEGMKFHRGINFVIVHHEPQFNKLYLSWFSGALGSTEDFQYDLNAGVLGSRKFAWYHQCIDLNIVGSQAVANANDFLPAFLQVLNSLAAMTVIKMKKRPKLKARKEVEGKAPKRYVLITDKKERKQYLKRKKNMGGKSWSHCWEVMGHYRRILGCMGHDMDGKPMQDWTWVKPHFKGNQDMPVLKKVRLVGADNKHADLAK